VNSRLFDPAKASTLTTFIMDLVRNAQLMKVPYMLIVGDQEVADVVVSLRRRDGVQQNGLSAALFKEHVQEQIAKRSGTL